MHWSSYIPLLLKVKILDYIYLNEYIYIHIFMNYILYIISVK